MIRCKEIINSIEKIAPECLAEAWDNSGLIIGNIESEVKNIVITLDVTLDVVNEAVEKNADMIICHHPMLFKPLKKINYNDYIGNMIFKLIKNNIAVYTVHTNMDIAKGGLNDILAKKLNLKNITILKEVAAYDISQLENKDVSIGLGRIGQLENNIEFSELIDNVKKVLNAEYVTYVGNESDTISKIAICTGSGADLIENCIKYKVDAFITGDVKYHSAQLAKQNQLNLIDAGHYETENIIVPFLIQYLKDEYKHKDINIFAAQSNPNIFKIK